MIKITDKLAVGCLKSSQKHQIKALKLLLTGIDELPEELKMEILSRLPAKDVCRCKCVSREWCKIISDPNFLPIHQQKSKGNPQLVMLDESITILRGGQTFQKIHLTSADIKEERVENEVTTFVAGKILDMLPSGHGLVCITTDMNFYVFNPSTQEIIGLPKPSPSIYGQQKAGFGYLPSTKEYKLVHMFHQRPVKCDDDNNNGDDGDGDGDGDGDDEDEDEDEDEEEEEEDIGCEIFTLLDGVLASPWRVIEEKCPYPVFGRGVCVDQVFFWKTWDESQDSGGYNLIISLDTKEEKFDTIFIPQPSSHRESNDILLVELNGNLCLTDTLSIPPILDIWMLKDPKNKVWEKQYSINLLDMEGFDDDLIRITPLGYINGEIIIDSWQERLDYYNIQHRSFRKGNRLMLSGTHLRCLNIDNFFSLRSVFVAIKRIPFRLIGRRDERDGAVIDLYNAVFPRCDSKNIFIKEALRMLCQLKTTPAVRHFIWRLCFNDVPTKANYFRGKSAGSERQCPICKAEEETIEHMPFLCPWVRPVWFGCPLSIVVNSSRVTWFGEWFLNQARRLKNHNYEVGTSLAYIAFLCWNIWMARCRFCLEEDELSPALVLEKSQRNINGVGVRNDEVKFCRGIVYGRYSKDKRRVINQLKFNICASRNPTSGAMEAGMFCRNALGGLLLKNISRCFRCSELAAQAMAVRDGMCIAVCMQASHISLETNSEILMEAIKNHPSATPVEITSIVDVIVEIAASLLSVEFTWANKQYNLECSSSSSIRCL